MFVILILLSSSFLQVCQALEHLKKVRRKLARFGWLVEACNHYQFEDEGADDAADFEMQRTVTGISKARPNAGDTKENAQARRDAQVQVVSCSLILINAIIGFPEELKERVKLRGEFIRLSLLDVLSSLHREKNVDVQRQVEVFETEMGGKAVGHCPPNRRPWHALHCRPSPASERSCRRWTGSSATCLRSLS